MEKPDPIKAMFEHFGFRVIDCPPPPYGLQNTAATTTGTSTTTAIPSMTTSKALTPNTPSKQHP